eukprot:scaffold4358_cov137-Isochrysis_galbana.AAC.5
MEHQVPGPSCSCTHSACPMLDAGCWVWAGAFDVAPSASIAQDERTSILDQYQNHTSSTTTCNTSHTSHGRATMTRPAKWNVGTTMTRATARG